MEYYVLVHKKANSRTESERERERESERASERERARERARERERKTADTLWCGQVRSLSFPLEIFKCPEMHRIPGINVVSMFSKYTVIPRLTEIFCSGITFVSRNVISRRFL